MKDEMVIKEAFLVASVAAVLLCAQPAAASLRRVCYYTNWAQYRPGKGNYLPENVDPFMCTHYIYAFSAFDEQGRIKPYEWNDESTEWSAGMYERFHKLKDRNPALKTLLAVGGWNVGSGPFTEMVTTQQSRAQFIQSAITLLRKWSFDGLDVDWEYPANRGSPAVDRVHFTSLIVEMREAFEREGLMSGRPRLLLTAAVAAGKSTIDTAYEITSVIQHVDFVSIMAYDLHGSWETVTGHHTALYRRADETGDDIYLNVDFAVNYWVQLGAPKEKLNIGLATYWRTFTLSSPYQTGLGAQAKGPGKEGPQTRTEGFLAYYEVCDIMHQGGQMHEDPEQYVRYISNGDQWAGGEDIVSITKKTCYIKQHGFGGVMVWAPDLDDFSGTSCQEGTYPLMNAVIKELNSPSYENCPSPTNLPVFTTPYPTPQLHTTQPPWHVDTTHPPYIPLETWVPPYTTNPPHTPSPSSGHGLSEIYDFSCMNLHNGFYPNPNTATSTTCV
ncbi:chitotriosidase-1-like isoform X1 [Pomacea canaliculata]|uniref:chitotriosidase-1-like isoform X1 n=2 Tax=Pomacea canaliculata TaxID=400727 RepID=UPI000D72F3E4|nr:chitotriosidase-1-like isoform X1 [Pomacea canaliculata]